MAVATILVNHLNRVINIGCSKKLYIVACTSGTWQLPLCLYLFCVFVVDSCLHERDMAVATISVRFICFPFRDNSLHLRLTVQLCPFQR